VLSGSAAAAFSSTKSGTIHSSDIENAIYARRRNNRASAPVEFLKTTQTARRFRDTECCGC
jgi:hypothetical protein